MDAIAAIKPRRKRRVDPSPDIVENVDCIVAYADRPWTSQREAAWLRVLGSARNARDRSNVQPSKQPE